MKKIVLIIALLILVVTFSINPTLAYLSELTSPIINTFTVGNVHITLSEPSWDPAQIHSLVPDAVYLKDPTATVDVNSEPCYVAIKVSVPIALNDIIALTYNTTDWTLAKQVINGTNTDFYYSYNGIVTSDGINNSVLPPVYSKVTVLPNVTNEMLAALGIDDKQITNQAFAIQSAGFASQTLALAAWIPA